MIVEDLIKLLQAYNSDAEVYVYTGDVNLMEVTEVEQPSPAMVVIS